MLNRFKFGVIGILLVVAIVALVPLFFKDVGGKFNFWKKSAVVQSGSATAGAAPAAAGSVGSYGSKQVARESLSSNEKMKLFEAENQVYNAIEQIVVERYIADFFEEYAKSNKLPDSFAAQREFFKDKVTVSEAEVQKLLFENKDNPNLQKVPEAERAGQVRQYLEGNARRTALRDFVEAAKRQGEIVVSVPKPVEPRLELTDGGNSFLGPKDAKVTIVEFADYQCPFCARMLPTLHEVMKKYEGKVRWVYRDFPLREIHPEALPAAIAASCAGAQGKYFDMHGKLFDNHQNLNSALYTKLATEIGLDMAKFETCKNDPKVSEEVITDLNEGQAAGVQGTPSYYVNGRKMGNGGDLKEFSRVIDEELARM